MSGCSRTLMATSSHDDTQSVVMNCCAIHGDPRLASPQSSASRAADMDDSVGRAGSVKVRGILTHTATLLRWSPQIQSTIIMVGHREHVASQLDILTKYLIHPIMHNMSTPGLGKYDAAYASMATRSGFAPVALRSESQSSQRCTHPHTLSDWFGGRRLLHRHGWQLDRRLLDGHGRLAISLKIETRVDNPRRTKASCCSRSSSACTASSSSVDILLIRASSISWL